MIGENRSNAFWRARGKNMKRLVPRLPDVYAELCNLADLVLQSKLPLEMFSFKAEDADEWHEDCGTKARWVWYSIEAPRKYLEKLCEPATGFLDAYGRVEPGGRFVPFIEEH